MDIRRLSDVKRTIPVVFEDDDGVVELSVTYRLSALNMKLSDWIAEHGDDRGSLLELLEQLIARWDVTQDGVPIPPTVEAMEQHGIGTPILWLIRARIYEDSAVDSLKKSYASVSLGPVLPRPGMPSS